MNTDKTNRIGQNSSSINPHLCAKENQVLNDKIDSYSWLYNFLVNFFRHIYDRQMQKYENSNPYTSVSKRKITVEPGFTAMFDTNIVHRIEKIELAIENSKPETKQVMFMYFKGHNIDEITRKLEVTRKYIIKHIHEYHFNITQ